jgi:hypothetical protein
MATPGTGARMSSDAQPTDGWSELLRYDSCHTQITFLVQGSKQEKQEPHKQQVDPHAYQEVTNKKDLWQAFLGGGSILMGLDEDGPTITTMAPPVASNYGRTCKVLNR